MSTDDDAAAHADDLSVAYPRRHGSERFTALRGVTLTIARGELVGLVGEAGSGKSTFARVLAGRTGRHRDGPAVVGGALTVLGVPVRTMHERGRRRVTAEVGYLPQDGARALDPGLTVAENAAAPFFERDKHYDSRDAGRRVAVLIDAVQLPLSVMAKYPHELSSGQRQRVAMARSLVLEPRLWVADEPTASVDVTARGPVLATLLQMQREREFSALIISHDAAVMARVTSRLAVLHRGVLVGLGSVDDVLARPTHEYVHGLAADYRTRTGSVPVVEP